MYDHYCQVQKAKIVCELQTIYPLNFDKHFSLFVVCYFTCSSNLTLLTHYIRVFIVLTIFGIIVFAEACSAFCVVTVGVNRGIVEIALGILSAEAEVF